MMWQVISLGICSAHPIPSSRAVYQGFHLGFSADLMVTQWSCTVLSMWPYFVYVLLASVTS